MLGIPAWSGATGRARPRLRGGALILGGAHGSLAVARSLGRRGVPVWHATDDHPIPRFSRYVRRAFTWPGPDDPDAAGWLVDLSATHGLEDWMLVPGGDGEVRFIARHHQFLAPAFRLVTPAWDVAERALDKRLTRRHAASVGVVSPWSLHPRDRTDILRADIPCPVILKPMTRTRRNAFTEAKAWRADDLPALLARYDEAARLVDPRTIGIQEYIPGGGEAQFSYAGVWSDGEAVASLVARRSRQYPIDFGFTSTFVETVSGPEVEAQSQAFLAALAFSGLVEMEYKHDSRSGQYKLLDVNMRPWTWIGLGAAAGVDFPYIQWRLAQGLPVEPCVGLTGVSWAYAPRDAVAVIKEVTSGRRPLRTLREASRRASTHATFALDDPLPGIIDLPLVAKRVVARSLGLRRDEAPGGKPLAALQGDVADGGRGW